MGKQSNSCDSPSTNPPRTMISRSAIGPKAQLALRRQCCAHPANRRGLAASISGSTSFSYETADVNGVKVASRDVAGPTTKLAVVAKAGTRYQSAPGLTSGLEQFAFKNTLKRSALRITRESELLGGQLTAYHQRGPSHRSQIPQRRFTILHRIAWRGCLADKVHRPRVPRGD